MTQVFQDAQQAAGFVTPALYRMHSTVFETKYPAFNYAEMVPVNAEGDMWDIGTIVYSGDFAGAAEYIGGKGFDIPNASVNFSQGTSNFYLAGAGYELFLQEVNRASRMGVPLDSRKANAARQIAEKFVYDVAMAGKSEKSITGFINNAGVPTANAPTGSWNAATPDQMIADVNTALTDVYSNTKETELADTLALPTTAFLKISTTRLTEYGGSILKFIQENNAYTAITRQPLSIVPSRELETAGAGSTRRMVAYARNPGVLEFFLPGMFEFMPPFAISSMGWRVDGIMNVGQLEIYRPKGLSYRDNI